MEREPETPPAATPLPWAMNAYEWLQGHLPKSRRGRLALAAVFGVLVMTGLSPSSTAGDVSHGS